MNLSLWKHYKAEHLQNHSPKYLVLIISISSPLLIGIYKNEHLIETITSEQKTSETLLPILLECFKKYNISKTIYTRGPGSYMAIKLTYITLKTIEITTGIKCFGCSGFSFNGAKPIKAIGSLYFIKEKETIITKKYEQSVNVSFTLPQSIHDLEIDEESTPEYSLPAV